jgi:3-hydroxyisobutyrate dehydrogenase
MGRLFNSLGVGGAEKATLTFMVGGSGPSYDRSKVVLSMMGKNIVHCGNNGLGQVAKLCNNMLLGTTMIAASEALHLAQKLGMNPTLMSEIINTSSGRSWSTDTYNPVPGIMPGVPSAKDYEGGFGITLMKKDMGLATEAALNAKASIPLSSAADQIYLQVTKVPGLEKKDFSVVYQWLTSTFTKYLRS